MTDVGVQALASGCPRLRALGLWGLTQLTDRAMTSLATNCKQLRTLGVFGCSGLTDGGLQRVAECLPSLTIIGSPQQGCLPMGTAAAAPVAAAADGGYGQPADLPGVRGQGRFMVERLAVALVREWLLLQRQRCPATLRGFDAQLLDDEHRSAAGAVLPDEISRLTASQWTGQHTEHPLGSSAEPGASRGRW